MASPNVSHYVSTGRLPVKRLSDFRTEPTLANIMAHQKYLKCLSIEAHSLHQWSRLISEQIIAEREQAHLQLVPMLANCEARTAGQCMDESASLPEHTETMQPPPAHPQMGSMQMQMSPPSATLQAKPAPSSPPAQLHRARHLRTSPSHLNKEQIYGHKRGVTCASSECSRMPQA